MAGAEQRDKTKRFVLWHSTFVALSLLTVGKLLLDPSSTIGPWPVLLLLGAYLLVRDVRTVGWTSVGAITAGFAVVAFWLKWMVGSQPFFVSQRLQYDNEGAVIVSSLFVLSMGVGYTVMHGRSRIDGTRDAAVPHSSAQTIDKLSSGTTAIIALAGVLLVFARLGLAVAYNIGVPGVLPTDPGGLIRPVTSLVYYVSVTAPLVFTAVLPVHGPPRWGWATALALGSAYGIAGAAIGYRSYPVLAFLALVFSWLLIRSRPGRGRGSSYGPALALAVAGAGALASLRIALRNRAQGGGGAPDQGVADFLSGRVGGLDYLSPVVYAVDRYGPSLEFASPGNWDLFMRVAVYGLPPGAVTGFAATLPGWLYGVGSLIAVVVGGLFAGWGARRVDGLCLRGRLGPRPALGTAVTIGVALCWLNLLAEGTLRASALQAGGYLVAALAVGLLAGQPKPEVSRPSSRRALRSAYGATPDLSEQAPTTGT